jgi:hypothetical protein
VREADSIMTAGPGPQDAPRGDMAAARAHGPAALETALSPRRTNCRLRLRPPPVSAWPVCAAGARQTIVGPQLRFTSFAVPRSWWGFTHTNAHAGRTKKRRCIKHLRHISGLERFPI